MEWFSSWFDSKYYHILYQHRNDEEAHLFIDSLIEKYQPSIDAKMLDLACGKGRHSIYLANKGFDVTGVDLSKESIEHASQYAHDRLRFHVHDMREQLQPKQFNFIFNFFTSFGYFSKEQDHHDTLSAIRTGLKDDGLLVMDFMNGHKAIQNLVPEEKKTIQGITFNITREVTNGVIVKTIQFEDGGHSYSFEERVRAFNLSEMARMFRKNGLELMDVYGDYELGAFNIFDSGRMIMVCKLLGHQNGN